MMQVIKRFGFGFICLLVLMWTSSPRSTAAQDTAEAADSTLEAQVYELTEQDQCVVCHLDIDEMPPGYEEYDIHLQEGLSCAGCHGGDPTTDDEEIAMDPDNGFVGVPSRSEIPQFCGKCHASASFMHGYQPQARTDQLDQYFISSHGQALANGDTKVAECASCHSAHAIVPASDARSTVHAFNIPLTCRTCHADAIYMREYGLRTNQFREYSESVHGVALLEDHDAGAPACNDCHGNHGALPPEVEHLGQVCGTCHVNNLEFFSNSPMLDAFEDESLHACVECHGAHGVAATTDSKVGTTAESICLDCHDEGDAGYMAADLIYSKLDSLTTALDSATEAQAHVVRIGMDDVEIDFLLRESRQALIRARTLVHTFDPDQVGEMTTEGRAKATEALELSALEIRNHRNRRVGFGLASVFLTLLALGIYLKIKEVDKDLPWIAGETRHDSGKFS